MWASDYGKPGNFVIHISTSDLVSQLVVDSQALNNEFHEPGVYDESGDYVPQYSDDPRDIRHIGANDSTTLSEPEPTPGAQEGNTPPAAGTPPSAEPGSDGN